MPILQSAKKALRVSQRKTITNNMIKSRLKTAVDDMKKQAGADKLNQAFSAIDRAVKKHLVQKNKAARLKSSLSKLLK